MKQRRVIQRKHKSNQFELNAFERSTRKLFIKYVYFHTQALFYLRHECFSVYSLSHTA